MFRQTVAIIRFYFKLYINKETSVYTMCATTYQCRDPLPTYRAKFISYGLGVDSVSRWSGPVD